MRRILIAEASPVLCEALVNCLKTQYDVTFCFDGQEVIAYINKYAPDLLVLDLELPNRDGIAALNMLRCAGNNVPVVALTANASECVMQILNSLKVSYVCSKPCSLEALVCSIRMVANIEDSVLWIPETEVDNLLLHLGFRMGLTRYDNVRAAILMKYHGTVDGMTKSCILLSLPRTVEVLRKWKNRSEMRSIMRFKRATETTGVCIFLVRWLESARPMRCS